MDKVLLKRNDGTFLKEVFVRVGRISERRHDWVHRIEATPFTETEAQKRLWDLQRYNDAMGWDQSFSLMSLSAT